MATVAWPSFPGLEPTVKRVRVDRRIVFEGLGGTETVVNVWPSPRYRYTLSYKGLRDNVLCTVSPWTSYHETDLIDYLANRSNLGLDQLTYVDPIDGTTRNVRVESDELGWEQDGTPTWWKVDVVFLSQL